MNKMSILLEVITEVEVKTTTPVAEVKATEVVVLTEVHGTEEVIHGVEVAIQATEEASQATEVSIVNPTTGEEVTTVTRLKDQDVQDVEGDTDPKIDAQHMGECATFEQREPLCCRLF